MSVEMARPGAIQAGFAQPFPTPDERIRTSSDGIPGHAIGTLAQPFDVRDLPGDQARTERSVSLAAFRALGRHLGAFPSLHPRHGRGCQRESPARTVPGGALQTTRTRRPRLLFQPVLDLERCDARKFADIVGDEDGIDHERVRYDIGPDGRVARIVL